MTEDEAKAMTCPTMQFCVNEDGVIQSGQSAIYAQNRCMGSACMAWRSRADWIDGGRTAVPGGYCGLAGDPS